MARKSTRLMKKKEGYTYCEAELGELMELWESCLAPGTKAGVLVGEQNGKSKYLSHWQPLKEVVEQGDCFLVELPHHLVAIDIDSPMSTDGRGKRILDYLDSKEIYYVLATSGSDGWVLIINLWTTLNPVEASFDISTVTLDPKIKEIKDVVESLIPSEDWNSRIRRSIRPPLSPYPQPGSLSLLMPSNVSIAAKILSYSGVLSTGVNSRNNSVESIVNLKVKRETRASHFMSLANSLIQSGYHFEDYKNILKSERTPIGKLYLQRASEYSRSDTWVEKDLQVTWEKAAEFVKNNPALGQIRIQILDWVVFAWSKLLDSTLPQPTRIRLIAYVLTIGKIAYEACSLEPVIGEKRMAAATGTSNKTVFAYKFLMKDLGLLDVSFDETPDELKRYGTQYRLRIDSVVFTDVNSPINYIQGNRDITSVKVVNVNEIRQQIISLLEIWQPHELWLKVAPGRVKGRIAWALLRIFPTLQLGQLCSLLGWKFRIGREVLIKLQQLSLIYWDEELGKWICYEEDSHWQHLISILSLEHGGNSQSQ